MKIERIKEVYAELEQYLVQLHPDPRSLGPLYLNDLIAKTRNYLNAVSLVQLEVHREKQHLSRDLRAREAAYQLSFDDLLANDDRVRRLPSIEDRKATVGVFLRDERQAIEGLKAALQDLEFVDKAVRHRHKELTATMSEIKLQRSLIRDEIDTGAMYGDERVSAHERKPAAPVFGDDMTEEELERLMESTATPRVSRPQTAPPAPALVPAQEEVVEPAPAQEEPADPTERAIAAFLGDAPSVEDDSSPDEDFLEVFANLLRGRCIQGSSDLVGAPGKSLPSANPGL